MLQSLMQDSQLLTVIETHKGLNGQISDDLLLDDPEYLEANFDLSAEQKYSIPCTSATAARGKKTALHGRRMDGTAFAGLFIR